MERFGHAERIAHGIEQARLLIAIARVRAVEEFEALQEARDEVAATPAVALRDRPVWSLPAFADSPIDPCTQACARVGLDLP